MGKQYKVKDINKNGVKEQWEIDRYAKINQSQGTAQFGIIKHLSGGGSIYDLLKSKPGSQSVLKPNRSVNNMSNMVRQQTGQPMGMDVSTNAQILNQAYDPRMAVNNMQGMAKKGSIGPAFGGPSGPIDTGVGEEKNKEDEKIKKLVKKEKENQESDKTSSRKTAANQQKIKNQLDKKKRLARRAKRKEGRKERKEIRKKAREGKMTRGEKRHAIIDSRDKQKSKKKKQDKADTKNSSKTNNASNKNKNTSQNKTNNNSKGAK